MPGRNSSSIDAGRTTTGYPEKGEGQAAWTASIRSGWADTTMAAASVSRPLSMT